MDFELFFDCEVSRRNPDGKYLMSICGFYDTETSEFDSVNHDEIQDFIDIASEANLIVCFNGFRFDYSLFETLGVPPSYDRARAKTFDLYYELALIVYGQFPPPKRKRKKRKKNEWPSTKQGDGGLDLDSLGKINLGYGKVELTISAAKLWESGKYELVEAYNKQDVLLTRNLFWQALNYEFLKYETDEGNIEEIDCSDFIQKVDDIQKRDVWGW